MTGGELSARSVGRGPETVPDLDPELDATCGMAALLGSLRRKDRTAEQKLALFGQLGTSELRNDEGRLIAVGTGTYTVTAPPA